MILFIGPRLDRPSAVGTEGRPRAVGLAGATVLVGLYAALLGQGLNLWEPLQLVASGVGLLVAGIALVGRDDPLAPFVGHLIFLPGGLLAIGGIAVSVMAGPAMALLVAGVAVALLGIGGAWADIVGGGTVTNAVQGGAVALAILFLGIITVPLTVGFTFLLWRALEPALFPAAPPGLAGLLFVIGMSSLAIRLALPRLPVVELAPRARRSRLARHRRSAARLATGVAVAGLLGWMAVGLGELFGPLRGLRMLTSQAPLVSLILGAPLRVPIATLGVLAGAGAVLAVLIRRLARLDAERAQGLAPVLGGIGLLAIPVPVLFWLLVGIAGGSPGLLILAGLAILLVFVGGLLVVTALALLAAAAGVGVLPDRAAPLALAAAGLIGTTLGVGLSGAPAPLVFLGVGSAMLTWDVSEFGLGLTAELGHLPETQRVELLHTVTAVGVGLMAIVLALGLLAAVHIVGAVTPAAGAVTAVAVIGIYAMLAAISG